MRFKGTLTSNLGGFLISPINTTPTPISIFGNAHREGSSMIFTGTLLSNVGGFSVSTPAAPEPPATNFVSAVNDAAPLAFWMMDPSTSEDSELIDQRSLQNLVEAAGEAVEGQPVIVDDYTGEALFFRPSDQVERYEASNAAFNTLEDFTVIVHFVSMDVTNRTEIFVRENGAPNPGGVGIEIEPGGVLRVFYVKADNTVLNLRSSAGAVVTGETYAVEVKAGSGTLKVRLVSASGSTVTLSDTITVVAQDFARAIAIGSYYADQIPFKGIIQAVQVYDKELSDADADEVMRPINVVFINDFVLGAQSQGTEITIDPLDLAIFKGTKSSQTITLGQPTNSTLTDNGDGTIKLTAGTTNGADSGTISIGGSNTATISFSVVDAPSGGGDEDVRSLGDWFGSFGWGATAGNIQSIGRVYDSASIRFEAERSGTVNKFRFDCPTRPGYFQGTGGVMRLTLRSNAAGDEPDMTGGGIIWQSAAWQLTNGVSPAWTEVSKENYDVAVDATLVAGNIYHWVWTNEDSNPTANNFSINACYNISMPHLPFHPYVPWAKFNTLTNGNPRNRWIPYFLMFYDDGVVTGQTYFDAGSTGNIMTIAGGGSKQGNSREIGGDWQIRQRWTHNSDTVIMTRWRGRVWRTSSNTTYPLLVDLIEEGTGVIASASIPASSVFQTTNDNQAGQVFDCVDVALDQSAELTNGETYQLRLRTTNDDTRFAMRAPNGGPKGVTNLGWSGWLGRGEYSINGGSSWTGMHMYNTDNRDTNDWNMALHNING